MPRTRPPLAVFLIPALALVLVLPLILGGYSCGHDFDFHLVSWMEAAAQFRAGNLAPSWAFSPAWNAGEPRFVFYPPLSWSLGALLGLALPWGAVPAAYTWLALTAAGAGMYRFARTFAAPAGALIATAVYLANPYMLFTAYERTAYAELLAAAWIPLLLAGVLRESPGVLGIAVPVALLWLTNAPAAVMGCYAAALLSLMRLFWLWRIARLDPPWTAARTCLNLAARIASGFALGLGLAAIYILPAAYERRWVQVAMATIAGMRIEDNFIFHRIGDPPHDAVLHTASIIAVILISAAVIAFSLALARTRYRAEATSLALLAAIISFMLTSPSAALWRTGPELGFLQFPWRLLAVLAAIVCAGLALALADLPTPLFSGSLTGKGTALLTVGLLVLAAAVSLPAISIFRQGCDDEDTVSARLATFQSKTGTDPTDEYTPSNADNDSLAHRDPPFWLAPADTTQAPPPGPVPPVSVPPGPVPMHFTVRALMDESLVLNLRDYPAWEVRIDGTLVAEHIPRDDGLIVVPVHAGTSTVDIVYTPGIDQKAGRVLSLAAVLCLCGLALARRRIPPQPTAAA